MYIKLCDRCGRPTNNNAAILTPSTKENGSLHIGGTWFGNDITLCDDCIEDFENFMKNHKHFTIEWVEINE